MSVPIEELWSIPEPALIGTYHSARRQFVEKKFTRDTDRARLEWMRAKMFVSSSGGVTDRKMAVDVSEELARKGQELREMTAISTFSRSMSTSSQWSSGCAGYRRRQA